MSKIVIADLAESKTLDRAAMIAVRGGMRVFPSFFLGSIGNRFLEVNPLQTVSQFQGIQNSVGNNVANFGFSDLQNANAQTQNAQNNVNVGGVLI